MKTNILLLRVAGFISALFLIFHLAFNKLFNWNESLLCLSLNNRSILLTYHYECMLILFFMLIVLLFQPAVLLKSRLKFAILSFFILFYVLRITTEFTHFGFGMPQSPIIILLCLIPAILCAIPLIIKTETL